MSSATVTAYAGPGLLASGLVITNVTAFDIDTVGEILHLKAGGKDMFFALTGANTFTLTASGGTYTLTVA